MTIMTNKKEYLQKKKKNPTTQIERGSFPQILIPEREGSLLYILGNLTSSQVTLNWIRYKKAQKLCVG